MVNFLPLRTTFSKKISPAASFFFIYFCEFSVENSYIVLLWCQYVCTSVTSNISELA